MNILINRTDAIGDTILTLPMAKAIKKYFPEAKVVFLVSPRSADLFKNLNYVDEVVVLEKKGGFFGQLLQLNRLLAKPWHAYFYVGGSHIPSLWAWIRHIRIRAGIKSRAPSFLFLNRGQRQRRSHVEMHEREYNLTLLDALGIKLDYAEMAAFQPELTVIREEKESSWNHFKDELKKNNVSEANKLLFIHPGMTGHTLNWPVANYAKLILRCEQKFPGIYSYIISHTPSDEGQIKVIRQELKKDEYALLRDKIYFFNGALRGLRHTMAVLSRAHCFIGPSTGPTHIAAALGVPVTALYSPIKSQSSLRWGPCGPNVKIVVPDVICGEQLSCAEEQCPYFRCMESIEVEDVLDAATPFLE